MFLTIRPKQTSDRCLLAATIERDVGCVVSDLCDITVVLLMTYQVLHWREELFRKVCQSAEG